MNIEDSIKKLKEFNKIKINSYAMQFVNISYPDLQEAIETLLTAYEKEKEKNKELEELNFKYTVEIASLKTDLQEIEKENKKLNILRLELLISQFPDTTETYKKYKKELDELIKEE